MIGRQVRFRVWSWFVSVIRALAVLKLAA
jgi:hypothetical protein